MKKVIINIGLVITFLIIYFLQVNFFSWFRIFGVMPNVFVILTLFIGLFYNKIAGVTYGIFFGILLDLFIGKKVGISAMMLGIVGLIGGIFDKNFSKESRLTIMVMVFVSTIVFEFGLYFLGYLVFKNSVEILPFIRILLIEAIFNVIITIIVYPLMQNIGYKIENEVKGSKILTRYF